MIFNQIENIKKATKKVISIGPLVIFNQIENIKKATKVSLSST